MRGLTPKQERFVQEYLVDLNGKQAAIRAGYSPNSAKQIASENLTKPDLSDALGVLVAERAQELKVDRNYVTRTLIDTIERCRGLHLVRDRRGDVVKVETEDGQEVCAVQFDAKNVVAGLGLLGRHLGMEKIAVTDPNGDPFGTAFMDRLELARRAVYMLTYSAKPPIEGEATPA